MKRLIIIALAVLALGGCNAVQRATQGGGIDLPTNSGASGARARESIRRDLRELTKPCTPAERRSWCVGAQPKPAPSNSIEAPTPPDATATDQGEQGTP